MDSTRHRICNPQKFHLHPSPIDCGCHTKGRKDLEKLGLEHWQRSLQKGIIFFFFFPFMCCAPSHLTALHRTTSCRSRFSYHINSFVSSTQSTRLTPATSTEFALPLPLPFAIQRCRQPCQSVIVIEL